MRVPAKRVIDTILKIIEIYKSEEGAYSFKEWIHSIATGDGTSSVKDIETLKSLLKDVIKLPPSDEDPSSYMDYGSEGRFSAKTARGECAA
jgi:sulfite reductase (ferredoxin)